jgi:hypothetical protein
MIGNLDRERGNRALSGDVKSFFIWKYSLEANASATTIVSISAHYKMRLICRQLKLNVVEEIEAFRRGGGLVAPRC